MKALKSARTVAASLGVLAFGAMAATPAMAFDKVGWSWNAHVNEWVNINACIHLNVDISGMVQVEKLQIFLGNVSADSKVAFVDNQMYNPGGHWDFSWCWRAEWIPNSFDARIDLPAVISAESNRRGVPYTRWMADATPAQLASWTIVSRVLLNLDETITKE